MVEIKYIHRQCSLSMSVTLVSAECWIFPLIYIQYKGLLILYIYYGGVELLFIKFMVYSSPLGIGY